MPSAPQERKTDAASLFAVSCRSVPVGNCAVQVPGQVIPAGRVLTAPPPLPWMVTDSASIGVKLAVTAVTLSMAMVHVRVVPHFSAGPPPPPKDDLAPTAAGALTPRHERKPTRPN